MEGTRALCRHFGIWVCKLSLNYLLYQKVGSAPKLVWKCQGSGKHSHHENLYNLNIERILSIENVTNGIKEPTSQQWHTILNLYIIINVSTV